MNKSCISAIVFSGLVQLSAALVAVMCFIEGELTTAGVWLLLSLVECIRYEVVWRGR